MKTIEDVRRENLAAELKRIGSQGKLAKAIDKSKNQIYQWLTDNKKQRRNIHGSTAREIEPLLEREPGWFDVDHSAEKLQPIGLRSSGQELAGVRSKNDVKALRFAVQSLFSVLHEKMPAVAEDVARDIVEAAGTEFSGAGFLNILLGYLRGADDTSGEVGLEPRRTPASPTSKRAVSVAKKT